VQETMPLAGTPYVEMPDVLKKLQTLSEEDLEKLREAFIKHCHARFILSLFSRDAFRLFLHQLPCKFGIDIGMLVVNRKKLISSFFVA